MPTGAFVVRRNGKVFVTGNSGFPKSHDVSKGIDKLAGAEREDGTLSGRSGSGRTAMDAGNRSGDLAGDYYTTAPATPDAERWTGWGTALKPAFEPIVLARKPLAEKTVAGNVLEHGTGGINIDACRVQTDDNTQRVSNAGTNGDGWGMGKSYHINGGSPAGRWPANVLLDEHAAAWVDEQSGDRPGFATQRHLSPGKPGMFGVGGGSDIGPRSVGFNDSGGASRFFKVAESDENGAISPHFPREFDDAFLYTAKAPKRERPNVDGIQHPTVKPLAIMRWLIRLVTPPGGTILDPFAGSGTTIEAAMTEGFHPIGIEKETDYLPLITARIARAKTSAQGVLDLGGIA